jgi:hypothetical protein
MQRITPIFRRSFQVGYRTERCFSGRPVAASAPGMIPVYAPASEIIADTFGNVASGPERVYRGGNFGGRMPRRTAPRTGT